MYRPAHELSRVQLQPGSHADYIFEHGQGFSSVEAPLRPKPLSTEQATGE
jgi:hypothetical protein